MTYPRLLTWLLVVVPVGGVCLFCLLYLWQTAPFFHLQAAEAARRWAQEQQDIPLVVGDFKLDLLQRRLEVRDVILGPLSDPLLVAKRVSVVQPAPRRLDIRISRATVHLIRLPDGRWNFSVLLPQRRLAPTDTFWSVSFEETTLHFTDYEARPPLQATLPRVNGDIRSWAGVVLFRFQHTDPPVPAQVQGWLHEKTLRLHIVAQQVPLPKLLSYLPKMPLKASNATVSGEVWVYTDEKNQVQYTGNVSVEALQTEWRTPRGILTLRQLQGTGTFRTGVASWKAQARLGTGSLEASGVVRWQPQLEVMASGRAREVPPRVISPWLKPYAPQVTLESGADAQLHLRMRGSDVAAEATLGIPKVKAGDLLVQDLRLKTILENDRVIVPRFELRIGGGKVAGRAAAWQHNREWHFAAQGDFQGLLLAQLKPYVPSDIRGVLSGVALAYGTSRSPMLVANVAVTRLSGKGWRFDQGYARLRWAPTTLFIDGAFLEDWSGSISLSGEVDLKHRRLALQTRVDEAQIGVWAERLAPYLPQHSELPSGWAYARGELTGSLDSPLFQGVVETTDLRWQRWDADYLAMRVKASHQQITIEDATLYRPPAEAKWQATIDNPLDPEKTRFVLSAVAQNVDLREVLRVLREEDPPSVEAFARVFCYAEGTPKEPFVQLSVSAPALQFQQWSLGNFTGSVRYAQKKLWLESVNARLGEGTLQAKGVREEDGSLSLQIEGNRLPLSPLRNLLPEEARQPLTGEMAFTGTISGSDRSPLLEADVFWQNVRWDALELGNGRARVTWQPEQLDIRSLQLDSPSLSLSVASLTFQPRVRHLMAEGTLRIGSLQRLNRTLLSSTWLVRQTPRLEATARELEELEGKIEVPFTIAAQGDEWVVAARALAEDLTIADQLLGNLQAEVERGGHGEWRLTQMLLANGEHHVSLSGTYTPDRELSLELEAYNVRLSWFQRWLPTLAELQGSIESATLRATGKAESPTLTLSFALRDLRYGELQIQRVLSGQVQISEQKIDISDLWLVQPEGRVRMWGYLPFRWEPLGIPEEQEGAVYIEAPEQPLKSLLSYFNATQQLEVEGSWQLQARVEGSRAQPNLSGELRVDAERLRVVPIATGLRNLRARARLSNDTIFLEELSAAGDTPRGGRLAITGKILVAAPPEQQIQARLRAERFWVEERNLSGQYGEQIRAFVEGELSLQGSWRNPQLTGTVSFSNGALTLPASFPSQQPADRRLAINPQFAGVVLRLQRGMWLNSPRLSAQAVGDIILGGSLQEPLVHGQIGLERGYISFPTARFRLEPGGTISIDYPVPGEAPLRVQVNVKATTNLSLLSPLGGRRRYLISVLANGTITAPEGLRTEFRSDPPELSPTQIARALGVGTIEELLAGRNIEQVLQREVVNLFTSAYIPQLFSPLERGIEEAFQLSEFGLEYSRQEPLTITLVKRLWGGFSLSYWRTVAAGQERNVLKILYELPEWTRLSRRLVLSFSVDEKQQQRWGLEGTLRF